MILLLFLLEMPRIIKSKKKKERKNQFTFYSNFVGTQARQIRDTMYPSIPLRAKLKTSAHQTGHFHALIMNSFPSEAQLGSRGTIIMSCLKNEIKRGKKGGEGRKRERERKRHGGVCLKPAFPHRK